MVYLVMDHLLMVLVLLWSSGLQAEDKHQSMGFQCESTVKADIMLLVEIYESTGLEDYRNIKSFLTQIVSIFDIGPDKVQIGLYQYNSDSTIDWHLNTHLTKQSLLKAIDNLQQRESRSILGRTLNLVLNYNFKSEFGMRAESQKIGILISDADAKDLFQDSQVPRDSSIEVYTIGVKNVNETQLRAIASDPHEIHMYSVSDLSFLLDIVDNLTINLCNSASVPVRLVSGTSLCSGRLEVKSEQSWFSMCEADFDQQDAQVACRELGCGPPSVLQGLLYEEVIEAPMWTKELRCGGHESSLLHCGRSDSVRSTCSSGKAVGLTCLVHVRLVGGARRCAGTLEVKQGEWRPVSTSFSILKDATVACTALDCGSAVSVGNRKEPSDRSVWIISSECAHSGSALWDCATSSLSSSIVELTCSESVRLVSGTSLCSGRLEVKSEQSWFTVCEADFDQQDAEVVCRELGCGPPSVLQGPLYVEVKGPMWAKEFQCGGHESSLLDCGRSDSARRTCSPGKAVGLTCSEPFRLVGRASRCAGTLELKQIVENSGVEWKPVSEYFWTLKEAAVVCRALNCGPAVSVGGRKEPSDKAAFIIIPNCVESGSALRDCTYLSSFSSVVEITCSDPVRLVIGTSLCSGRLEVKSEQSWFSVCEADFDQQDAKVVCRELGCGTPSVLQGVLYEEVEAPMWTKEFQCRGHESSLLNCGRSDSARSTCSSGKAVGLTCSEPVRLVGGASSCAGTLEVKKVEWRPVSEFFWTLKRAAVVCRALNCGSAVSTGERKEPSGISKWLIPPECVESASGLSDCASSSSFPSSILEITCSESVRLVSGTSLCSGRLEVKSEQSWFSVCEADFDQWDAEVVCRELNCGTPSVLQGVLYEEAEAPMWTKEFQCRGHESSLLDCGISDSARRTCSPSKAVRLTCSEPVRLMGGASRCAGTLEVKQVVWRPVSSDQWTLKEATLACRALDCGSAVSTGSRNNTSGRYIWLIKPECVQSGSALRDCATLKFASSIIMELTCSDLLVQPIISLSSTMGGVSDAKQQGFWVHQGSNFTISCSIQPQYLGGSFQLTFTSSDTTHNYTQLAVNHFADFLFTAADPTHQGNYSCVYNIYVFSHNFSSESRVLFLTVQDPTDHIIRLVVLLVTLPLVVTAIFFIFKANRGQKSGPQENIELDSYNLGVPRAEGEPVEEERAQGAELDPQGATQTH
ncbi:scavenger receptor cysteine-rich type 1 protein M130-like isoform X1 [Thunnus maccoyii]|uniref:scavenger receptor cysteine-rich type 1 protein M130-like isoform X1 n=1 Tax=Thunnus maccoyii TaxID=8240 RepID=UPI001C4B15F1|nr:scavenger receptor cysteine-rich type 1 protein M130-like isoform X1 [Thunnus maccoyii]